MATASGEYVRAAVVQAFAGLLSWRHYQAVPSLPPPSLPAMRWPSVSIVIPARDEAGRIGPLLASLKALDYPDYEIIVVDDDSGDGTAALAAGAGVRVLRGRPLPSGWTGKAFACHQGAATARGEWLLFTDADTVHAPPSLRAAIAYAHAHELDALSVLTGQCCRTFAERLLLPLAYALVFAGAAPSQRGGAGALINGHYILCRRAVYERIGGYRSAGSSIIEDAALARILNAAGIPHRLCRGEDLVRVRLYTGLPDLWAGFRKNAVHYAAIAPRRLPGIALHGAALGAALPIVAQAVSERGARNTAIAVGGYLTGAAGLIPWYRRFGVPAPYALLYPLGMGLLSLITLDAVGRAVSGRGSTWKGRTYGTRTRQTPGMARRATS